VEAPPPEEAVPPLLPAPFRIALVFLLELPLPLPQKANRKEENQSNKEWAVKQAQEM
jgi:hypothetical protein